MNTFLDTFAHLLDVVRRHRKREPSDGDLRRCFAAAAGVDEPPR